MNVTCIGTVSILFKKSDIFHKQMCICSTYLLLIASLDVTIYFWFTLLKEYTIALKTVYKSKGHLHHRDIPGPYDEWEKIPLDTK